MNKIFLLILLLIGFTSWGQNQNKITLSLQNVIDIASQQSIDAFKNKNMYLASYWEYRYYKAERLPSLSLSSDPLNFYRYNYQEYNWDTNEDEYIQKEYLNSDVTLSAVQNVSLTGGQFFVQSDLEMIKNLSSNGSNSYSATPISVGYLQDLNGYNQYKWESKIEPLKFEIAKKEFIQDVEDLRVSSTYYFFELIEAQIQKDIAEMNYTNADTLYKIGKGRFQVGTVTQDELLELELSLLNSKQDLSSAKLQEMRAQLELNSFLSLPKETIVECIIPDVIPALQIEPTLALEQALNNNPEIMEQKQEKLEQDENVAEAKSEKGLTSSIYAKFGLTKTSDNFHDVYSKPDKSQIFTLGLDIPIVDWGSGKGQYLMAKSDREVALATLKQERIDFEQDVIQSVLEFNLMAEQVNISAKADTVAQMGYHVTFQRFMIGKVDVIKLNIASSAQETARMAYISQLNDYWTSYYTLRSLTLFDFETKEPLTVDFNKLIQN